MTIKKKILAVNLIILVFATIGGWYLVGFYQKVPKQFMVSSQVNKLVHELFLLNAAMVNVQFRGVQRGNQQWWSISKSVSEILEDLTKKNLPSRKLNSLQDTNNSIKRLFKKMEEIRNTNDQKKERSDYVANLIRIKVLDMIMTAQFMLDEISDRLQNANEKANSLIVVFTMAIVIIMVNLQLFFRKTVISPLVELEKGVRIIGKGNFDYRIQVVSNDEIGHLATSINRMNHNLKILTKSKEEFLSTAAHELKTPLTVLKTTAELMSDMSKDELNDFLPYALKTINRQCDHLNKLVVEVLELSRLELDKTAMHFENVRLDKLIEDVCFDMSQVSDRHQIKIISNEPITVELDKGRIEQVLINLIDNAIKYSPKGGAVEVMSKLYPEKVSISVKDEGVGIPLEKQANVFERFYRAHAGTPYEQVTSMGVGLFLSKQFVQRHGGTIYFSSAEGDGSIFTFTLPLKKDLGGHGNGPR